MTIIQRSIVVCPIKPGPRNEIIDLDGYYITRAQAEQVVEALEMSKEGFCDGCDGKGSTGRLMTRPGEYPRPDMSDADWVMFQCDKCKGTGRIKKDVAMKALAIFLGGEK